MWVHWCIGWQNFDWLAPEKFELNFSYVIFKWILAIDVWVITCDIALIWMSLDFADDQSTLVQVMAWCRQATSHYLSQWWPRSLSPYGVNRPEWVNIKQYVAWNVQDVSLFFSVSAHLDPNESDYLREATLKNMEKVKNVKS